MTATRVKSVRRGKNHNEFKGRPALVRERSRVQSSLAAPLHAIDLATRSAASRKFNMSRDIPERDEGMDSKDKKDRSHLPIAESRANRPHHL